MRPGIDAALNVTNNVSPPILEPNAGDAANPNGRIDEGNLHVSEAVAPRCNGNEPVNKTLDPYEVLSSNSRGTSGLTDIQVYQKAAQSKNGQKFTQLWTGKTGHNARTHGAETSSFWHESAVAGLLLQIAFWTGKDAVQMDRMFRASGLMTPAWDVEGPMGTYGKATIDLVIKECADVYHSSSASRRGNPPTEPESLAVTTLSDVAMRQMNGLVPRYIPLGKLVLLAGEGGDGKSLLTLEMAACVTRGTPCFGLNYQANAPAEVLLISCEDDVADTIVPRLAAAGADLTRVHHVEGMRNKEGKMMAFNLAHYALREKELDERPDVRLVVIDPAGAYIGGNSVDDYKETDLRSLLGPLSTLAANKNVTVILVKHFGKAPSAKAVNKVLGSVAYVNTVRAAFVSARDVDNPERRFFLPLKFNLGMMPSGLAFTIESVSDTAEQKKILDGIKSENIDPCSKLSEQFTRVKWLGPVDITADEAVALSARCRREGASPAE